MGKHTQVKLHSKANKTEVFKLYAYQFKDLSNLFSVIMGFEKTLHFFYQEKGLAAF